MFWNRRNAATRPASHDRSGRSRSEPGAEDAWKALSLIMDLIRHAETRAGLTLAASGVVGGLVYTLIRSVSQRSAALDIAAAVTVLLAVGAACFAGFTSLPRLRASPEPPNLLYYHHIATTYRSRSDAYAGALDELVRDRDALVAAIAEQVWANAQIARQKYLWGGLGIGTLLAAVVALMITAALAAVGGL